MVLLKRERVKLRSFGEKLKRIRTKCGLTQGKFADEMNISLDTVKNWEQGYNYPSIDMLVSISEYFKCDLDYLIGQQSMPNKEFSHIADMIGISERAAALLVNAKEQSNPITEVLSELIENYSLLENIYSCSTANYGSVGTFIDVSDPFQPKGKRSMFVTPQKVRQADSMDLFNNLQEFVDNLRKKYGFPTSKER